ncbi:hypothetical protein LP421_33215 (plasmid) [Rhizobium sp. RCAM05350]|uniref:hypothetical protein n=1 Tax=Rhizobium sp. RCAM05350 TaxID=2895568 RepID=UPI00207685B8|nr:hypothetical protein [Rhizobium sp. RCAM05350]URK89517.1 hypothetical protein LP421_33215 [Rhizobium sp. RCAM05350]
MAEHLFLRRKTEEGMGLAIRSANDDTPAVDGVVALIEDRKHHDPLRLEPRRGYGARDRRLSLFIVELTLDYDRAMLVDKDRVATGVYIGFSITRCLTRPAVLWSTFIACPRAVWTAEEAQALRSTLSKIGRSRKAVMQDNILLLLS